MSKPLPILLPIINRENDKIDFTQDNMCEIILMEKYIQYTLQYTCERTDEYSGLVTELNVYNLFRILKEQVAIPFIMYANKAGAYVVVLHEEVPGVYFNEYKEAYKFLNAITNYITGNE